MRTVFTVLTLAFVSFAFLSGAFAVSSGTGAIGFIQADQCDSTTFYGCAKVFFSNLGQPLPIINDASFLKLFEDYLLANNIAGLKNTCQWLATFDSCSSHNCWTAANFKSLGVQESDYFATVFKAAFNLCNSNDVKFLLQDGDQCLSSISALDQIQFLGCVSGLISGGISNIPNIPCSTLATTLSCLFKALKKTSSCSANVDAALCQTIVFAVDMLLPNCKLQLDPTCTSAAISSTATAKTATQPPNTPSSTHLTTTTAQLSVCQRVTELIVRRKCVHCTPFSHNLRLRNIFSYYRVSKELAAMKNVSTVLVLVLVSLTLLHGSFAVSSDAGAIGVIQADQCDPNKLRTCVTSLFAGFGQRVPPDTTILINLLTNYILSNGISALSNIC
uniref:Uncharacterized protein n=1 Tax=Plectus sambesii TaxID=2011161 RepID=A0A914WVV0_9BILA